MSNLERMESTKQLVQMIRPDFNKLAQIHKAVTFEEESSFALQLLAENDYLARVAMGNPDSLKRAILNVAIIGLSLNPYKGEAYLIPRKGKICLDISYRGYINLAGSIGAIRKVDVEIVYKNDHFEYVPGHPPVHRCDPFDTNRGPIIGGYVVSTLGNGETVVSNLTIAEIEKIRERSESWKSYKKDSKPTPWVTDEAAMIKKTLVRNARKFWPMVDSHNRMSIAAEVIDESDPLLLTPAHEPNDVERADLLLKIRTALEILGRSEAQYLKHAIRITGHDLKSLDDMTAIEMKQAVIALSQLVDQKNEKEQKK